MNGPVPTLQARLEQVAARQRRLELACKLAACWAAAALAGLIFVIVERQSGWASSLALPIVALTGVIGAIVVLIRHAKTKPDYHALAAQVQARYPDLESRLITAIQQQPDPAAGLSFLQDRLLRETLLHSHQHDWAEAVPRHFLGFARGGHVVALVLFGLVLWQLRFTTEHGLLTKAAMARISVMPGDTIIERGNSLVVLARFGKTLPSVVELVVSQTPETSRRIPLVKSLADPVFGGSVLDVKSNFVYHIEYGGERTRDYGVQVFEYPRLERANADLTPPDYTGQPVKHVDNTRRVSAVEGTKVEFELQFNKPVVSAQLVSKAKDKESGSILALQVQTNRPVALLRQFTLETSRTYELRLVDGEGRTNKASAQFVFEALKNRTPELRLASPRGDLRPSPLEEIAFEGTVWDDFGVHAYGLAFTRPGEEPKLIELGRDVPGNEKRPFKHLLRLEDLKVQPDQLLAWFVWADDMGPDGQVRRTSGDMFFAEIRPFEEVFREGDSMDGQSGASSRREQGGSQSQKLGELQKQIISATWRLQREHKASPTQTPAPRTTAPTQPTEERKAPASSQIKSRARQFGAKPMFFGRGDQNKPSSQRQGTETPSDKPSVSQRPTGESGGPSYQEDVTVVRDSQSQVLEQAQTSAQEQDDPRTSALWNAAIKAMENAINKLNQATNSPAALPEALAAEQAAYEAFLKVQQHEYQVSRNQNRNANGGARGQQMQRQLEQMDLTKSENRYETQRQAQGPQTTERREQLQVQNRLQELARRQQDLNDRMKELQTALQEAKTEQEREEIRRRLKRLEEEEQQMVADVDELRQRMDRPENQSQMADEKRQLDQTREDVQRAAEAASQGSPSQALASGTRAQRQLQQLRDQVRKENSSQFAEDVREMRNEARELTEQQGDILKKMQQDDRGARRSLSESPARAEALEQLSRQKQRLTNLVDRATAVSQQAEDPEPLLSRQLYDTVRKFSQDTAKDFQEAQDELLRRGMMPRDLYERLKDQSSQPGSGLIDLTSELLRHDFLPQARDAGQRSGKSMEDFKRGVERAAQSVLGDDTEALKLAEQELNKITDELEKEMSRMGGGQATNGAAASLRPRNGRSGSQPSGTDAQAKDQAPAATGSQEQAGNSDQPGAAPSPNRESPTQGQGRRERNPAGNERNGAASTEDPGQNEEPNASPGSARNSRSANQTAASDGRGAGASDLDQILNQRLPYGSGPITGGDFGPWSDRLRDVEEMIDYPDLRNRVAVARERARQLRQESKRDLKKPDWAVVRLQVMKPLTEVRDRIAEELTRRESADALVPVDRDPVPNRYSDLVRRYYEGLGKAQ